MISFIFTHSSLIPTQRTSQAMPAILKLRKTSASWRRSSPDSKPISSGSETFPRPPNDLRVLSWSCLRATRITRPVICALSKCCTAMLLLHNRLQTICFLSGLCNKETDNNNLYEYISLRVIAFFMIMIMIIIIIVVVVVSWRYDAIRFSRSSWRTSKSPTTRTNSARSAFSTSCRSSSRGCRRISRSSWWRDCSKAEKSSNELS